VTASEQRQTRLRLRERTYRLIFEYNTSIEDRIIDLMIQGHKIADFHIMYYPCSRSVLMVNGEPDSEFQIVTTGQTISVVGQSMKERKTT
jgi:hypothetical protein